MKISIITVVFNNERTIRNALESVLSQTHPEIEYVVIDGGSTDGTLEIINSYRNRLSKIISERDSGIYDAMNKGLSLITGEVVGILNSDDFYPNCHVLEKVAAKFLNTGCDAIYGDLEYVDPVNTEKVLRVWKSGRYKKGSFLFGWMPPHPTFFVRKEAYAAYGTFNILLRTAADYELMLRMIHKHRLRLEYIPELLVKMRAGGESNRAIGNRIKANKEDRMAWKLNGLRCYFFTTWLKPVRKIIQFFPGLN